jgi:hypothetical protein
VNPAANIVGQMAVITIEPEPDNSPMPFFLRPLVDENIEDVGMEVLQAMANHAAEAPTGTATVGASTPATQAPPPQTMPVTGGTIAFLPLLPEILFSAGLFLLGGAALLRYRYRTR